MCCKEGGEKIRKEAAENRCLRKDDDQAVGAGQGYPSNSETATQIMMAIKIVTIHRLLLRPNSPVRYNQPTHKREPKMAIIALMTFRTLQLNPAQTK